jgi:uncharacterized membrane protein
MEENFKVSTTIFQKKHFMILLLLIVILGTFLRFHELSEESIWVDEAFTYDYIQMDLSELVETLRVEVHPIGFYLLHHYWNGILGFSEMALRFLPFIFGSLSIIVLFFLVRQLYDRRVALLSTLFFSLSYTFVMYSQEAKMYAQFILFFLLSILFFVRFLQKAKFNSNLIGLTLFNILMLHTHFLSFVVIFLEIVIYYFFYLLKKGQKIDLFKALFKKNAKYDLSKFNLFLVILFLSYVPWLQIFYTQIQHLVFYQFPLKFNEKLGLDGFYYFFILAILIMFAGLYYLYYLTKNKSSLQKLQGLFGKFKLKNSYFVLIFLGWIVVNLIFHQHFFNNLFYIRYLLFIFPLAYVFFAKRLLKLKKVSMIILLIVYLIASSFILFQYYEIDGKEQWREAAEYIEQDAGVNDILLFHRSGHPWWAFNYYYSGNLEQVRMDMDEDIWMLQKAEGHEHAYLILSHNYRTKELFKEEMDERYKLINTLELNGIKLYKYEVG